MIMISVTEITLFIPKLIIGIINMMYPKTHPKVYLNT